MIRKYRPEDLEAIKEITVICFDGVSIDQNIEKNFGQFADTDWKTRKAKHIDADVAANAEGIFVWEDKGKIAGYITTRIDHEWPWQKSKPSTRIPLVRTFVRARALPQSPDKFTTQCP